MPFSAARRIVSRREHATHSGGCGFWNGLGTTLRWRHRHDSGPSMPANGSSTNIRVTASRLSSHCARFVVAVDAEALELGAARGLAGAELDAPVGDEVERRDASRRRARGAGSRAAAAGSRARGGCAACAARPRARKTSEALECEYSSRKWCSTSQTESNPTRSAISICSSASWSSRCSPSSPHGPGQLVLVEDAEAHRRKASGPPDGRFGNAAPSRGPLGSVSVGAMAGVTINLLGGFAATVDGAPVADNGWRLRKARELVKLLALAPGHRAAPRAGDGGVVARSRPRRGGQQPAPGGPRRAAHARRGGDRRARRAAPAGRRGRGGRRPLRARGGRRPAARGRPPRTGRRRALYAGELLPENRYDDWVAGRREELAQLAASLADALGGLGAGERAPRPADRDELVRRARPRARGAACAARPHAGADARGHGRRGEDAARRSSSPAARRRPSAGDASSSSSRRWPSSDRSPTPSRRPSTSERSPATPSSTPCPRSSPHSRFCSCSTTASTCSARPRRSSTRCCASAPDLTVVATSREPLRVPGEVVFRVASLGIPDPGAGPRARGAAALRGGAAVRRACGGRRAGVRGRRGERGRCRAHLLPARRAAARARARRGPPRRARGRVDRRAPRRPVLPAARREPRPRRRASRRSPRPSSGATTCSSPRSACCSAGSRSSRAGSNSPRSSPSAPGTELEAAEMADLLARLVEKSLVSAEGRRTRAALPAARDGAHVRARAAARAGEEGALAERHAAWALAFALRERASTRCDAEAANLRAAFDTLLATGPRDALRLCGGDLAVLAAAHRPRRGASGASTRRLRRCRSARRCAPRRCSRRPRSTCGAAP